MGEMHAWVCICSYVVHMMCIWFAYDDCMLHVCAHVTVCVCINAPSTFGCKNTCTYMHIHAHTYCIHAHLFCIHEKYMQDKTVHLLYMYINVYACICMHLVYIQCSISMYLKYYVYTCLYKFQVSTCTMSGLKCCITCSAYWYVYLTLALLCNRGARQQCNSSTTAVQQLYNRTWSVTAVQ